MASLVPRTVHRLLFALALLGAAGPLLQAAGVVVCAAAPADGEGPPRDEDESTRDTESVTLPGTRADHRDRARPPGPSARLSLPTPAHPRAGATPRSHLGTPSLGVRLRC